MGTVVVWVGAKGVGKSYLGRLAAERLGVGFVDVEAIFRAMPDPSSVRAGYRRVLDEVLRRLPRDRAVSLELTGAAPESADLLAQLADVSTLRLVRVRAPLDLCLQRIAARCATTHLPATEELIRRVHERSEELELPFDLVVESGVESDAQVAARLAPLL